MSNFKPRTISTWKWQRFKGNSSRSTKVALKHLILSAVVNCLEAISALNPVVIQLFWCNNFLSIKVRSTAHVFLLSLNFHLFWDLWWLYFKIQCTIFSLCLHANVFCIAAYIHAQTVHSFTCGIYMYSIYALIFNKILFVFVLTTVCDHSNVLLLTTDKTFLVDFIHVYTISRTFWNWCSGQYLVFSNLTSY